MTAISNGSAILLIGGRKSPACPNKTMYVLSMNEPFSDGFQWSKVELHPESSVMEPRWRHTANCMNNISNGEFITHILYHVYNILSL